ncbi:MAG: tetratricopeptide repeat protein [Deltaproteobacteria bacterium]|nr:tetratricopeptide repeat protein [Deltaproteobacteria bacterium]
MENDFGFFLEEKGSDEKVDQLRRAHVALLRGENREALNLAEEVLETQPMDIDALNLVAVAAFNLNEVAMATALFRKIILLDPDNAGAHHNFGILLERTGHLEQAADHFRRCIGTQPDFPESYIHAGNILELLHRKEESCDFYRQALHRLPEGRENYFQRGYLLNRLGEYEQALENFRRSIAVQSQVAASHNGMGYVLSALERDREALVQFNRAVELNPQDASFHFNRGLSLLRLRQYREGVLSFLQALELSPGLWGAVLENIRLLIEKAPHDVVLELLEKAEKIRAGRPEIPFFRAVLLLEEGCPEEALKGLEESLTRNPESIQALHLKGTVLRELKRYDAALGCFDAILGRAGDVPLAHYGRAAVLALLGRAGDAVAALAAASEKDRNLLERAWEDSAFDPIRQDPGFLNLIRARHVS